MFQKRTCAWSIYRPTRGSMMVFVPSSLSLHAEPLSNKSCVTCTVSCKSNGWILDQHGSTSSEFNNTVDFHNNQNNNSNSLANHSWSNFKSDWSYKFTEWWGRWGWPKHRSEQQLLRTMMRLTFTFNPAIQRNKDPKLEQGPIVNLFPNCFPAPSRRFGWLFHLPLSTSDCYMKGCQTIGSYSLSRAMATILRVSLLNIYLAPGDYFFGNVQDLLI